MFWGLTFSLGVRVGGGCRGLFGGAGGWEEFGATVDVGDLVGRYGCDRHVGCALEDSIDGLIVGNQRSLVG